MAASPSRGMGMHITVIGLFASYAQAEAAVLDLEAAGIVGEQVQTIADPDRDARAEALGMKPSETLGDRIARVFGISSQREASALNDVHDASGDMPNYIGEQEFYATHVRSEGAILVVRVPSAKLASSAEAVLSAHGSKTRDGKNGVLTREGNEHPHLPDNARAL
jgi:hypothetical protein